MIKTSIVIIIYIINTVADIIYIFTIIKNILLNFIPPLTNFKGM